MGKYSVGIPGSMIKAYADRIVPWGEVGYVTYKRTYARRIENQGRTEEWHETCARACNGLVELGGLFTEGELELLYDHMFNLRGVPSGRALWQLGTDTVRKIGADSLQNCWLVTCNDTESFCFAFNQLMLGGGVGFNITPQFVYELPTIRHNVVVQRVVSPDCDFIVPDNREGWVELLRRVLHAFVVTGKPFYYYTGLIRAAGQPINGFGGTASGSEPLVAGLNNIVKILRSRFGKKLRPVDCLDIMNIIASIVVAGNVRRSAQIAIGHPFDMDFIAAKNWAIGNIPNWRSSSNNTIATSTTGNLGDNFWSGYMGHGEPYGLINLNNCRRFGRLADGEGYRPDYGVAGVNPCGELPLENKECCNLSDIFLPNIRSEKEFKEVAALLFKGCKTISCCDFSDPTTDEVVKRNRRIGSGITGVQAARHLIDRNILTNVYHHIEQVDEDYSRAMGVGLSVKLTTVKPSGTVSLLPKNCTPGAHCAFSRFLIRRIRFAASDPLVDLARSHGYHVEPKRELDGSFDHGTMVVSFPMAFDAKTVTEADVNVVDQLEMQKHLQTYWSDNSVSATHYFKPDELPAVREWLEENYESSVKSCSFLPATDHGFAQAPLEPITEEQYHELKSRTRPITRIVDTEETVMAESLECGSGGCPVR